MSAALPPSLTVSCTGPGDATLLDRHREAWDHAFAAATNEPSTGFEWTAALCRSHVAADEPIMVLRVNRGTTTMAVAALTTRRFRVLGHSVVAVTPVAEHYGTHSSIAAAERSPAVAEALVAAILGIRPRWDVFRMATLLEDDPWLPLLAASLRARGAAFDTRLNFPSYVLRLPDSFEAYLATRSAKFRNHLKRTARKVEALGAVAIDDLDRRGFTELFDQVLEVERRSWKHRYGTAISAVSRQTTFFQELGRLSGERSRLHVQVLTLDRRPVAHNIGYVLGDTYFYLKTSFDEACRSAGVSTYLRARLFAQVIARGLRVIDFPAEPYEWERQWADHVRWHRSLVVYGPTMTGRALRLIDAIRHRRSTPPSLAHWDARQQQPATSE